MLDRRATVLGRADLPAGHRVLRPGDLMTAEVDPQRMTVTVNSKGKIDNVYCG
ncbi:I78 family peptidase inhibitor [Gemmobacter sp.]|uniref:I78 family peptidase inhibitor n=1 Tax=Gemmobacter sp. TaxID=1898957 RepID=UPI0034522ED1